jgi:FkbM family methyltransferase
MMLQPSGRVIAFEPFPINYDRLVKNIRLNAAPVEPVLCALGDAAETRSIRFREQAGDVKSINYGGLRIPNDTLDGNLNIQIHSLDEIIPQYGATKISFIKIDVERWEVKVLRGAKQTIGKHRPTILVEIFDSSQEETARSHKHQIVNILRSWGYSVCRIIRKPIPYFRPVEEADFVPPVHFNALCIHRSLLTKGYSPMGVTVEFP